MISKKDYLDFPNCVEISNGEARLMISTDFGPRILFYGFQNGENILGLHPQAKVETAIGTWRPYGGHRLWMAPENMPLSYAPDNEKVEITQKNEFSASFVSPVETATKIQKEIIVSLSETGSGARVEHRITNLSEKEIEISAWALTIMRGGGAAIIPNEKHAPYSPETLLPVRTFAVWSYTDFTDPRWQFEKNFIRLKVDENLHNAQKIGVLNKQGWAAYEWENLTFVKRFDFVDSAIYPDMNSNTEVYTAGGFVEIETLSPLEKLAPEETIVHTEKWELFANKTIDELFEK